MARTKMDDYTRYDKVFKPHCVSPYSDDQFVSDIAVMRKELKGTLFINRVLKTFMVGSKYPPEDTLALKELHAQVCSNDLMSVPHKLSVFYYILLDFDNFDDGRLPRQTHYAENFAFTFAVPEQYRIFMKGLWLMDRGEFTRALEYLAHPSVIPEFADDIIITLVQVATKVGERYDYSDALAYYYTVQPTLVSSSAITALFEAMAQTSLIEAFFFSRTKPDAARELLFQQLIKSVLVDDGSDISSRAIELVGLPLDGAEEQWFNEYLTTGKGKTMRNAQDTVTMRRIVIGRYDEKLDGEWGAILAGFKSGISGHVV